MSTKCSAVNKTLFASHRNWTQNVLFIKRNASHSTMLTLDVRCNFSFSTKRFKCSHFAGQENIFAYDMQIAKFIIIHFLKYSFVSSFAV